MSDVGAIQGSAAAHAAVAQQQIGTAVLQKTQENARAQGQAALSLIEEAAGGEDTTGDDGHLNVIA